MALKQTRHGVFVYRSKARWVVAVLLLAMAVSAAAQPIGNAGTPPSSLEIVLFEAMAALIVLVAIRSWFWGLVVNDRELLVRNAVRTHRLPRHEVVGFRPSRFGFVMYRGLTTAVLLREGREIRVGALGVSGWSPKPWLSDMIDECYQAMAMTDPAGLGLARGERDN